MVELVDVVDVVDVIDVAGTAEVVVVRASAVGSGCALLRHLVKAARTLSMSSSVRLGSS